MEKKGNTKGAILVYGGNKRKRLILITKFIQGLGFCCGNGKELSPETLIFPSSPDFLRILPEKGKSSIGIDESKKIIKFLSQKPYEKDTKLVFIENAQYLTIQAQNALLKTLEELPDFATVIMECGKQNELLETVVSRCQKFFAGGKQGGNITKAEDGAKIEEKGEDSEIKPLGSAWTKIKNLSPRSKLDLAEKMAQKDREEVIGILENWIAWEKAEIIGTNPAEETSIHAKNLRVLTTVWEDLKFTNVNLGLALDFLLGNLE